MLKRLTIQFFGATFVLAQLPIADRCRCSFQAACAHEDVRSAFGPHRRSQAPGLLLNLFLFLSSCFNVVIRMQVPEDETVGLEHAYAAFVKLLKVSAGPAFVF